MEIPREPTWEDVEKWSVQLSEKIGDYKPDFVIGISRGGWIPAVLLSRLKGGWSLIPIDILRIGEERKVIGLFALDVSILIGKNILLVEDILETGKSFIVARKFLEERGATVKTACYIARDFCYVQPDYVIATNISCEIIFPWERLGR